MELPQPTHKNYTTLITSIENGTIKIPQFQRDFVWTLQRSAELLDSIVKGYPIGTFIFWSTRERLRSVKKLGNIELPTAKEGESVSFVLDGQQRLTSLFAAFKGEEIDRENRESSNFAEIYINLSADESEAIVTTDVTDLKENTYIRLRDLLYGGLTTLAAFPKEHHAKLEEYKRRIEAYDFPIIEVSDVPIDVATEIFTRINVGGEALTVFEIMVAKTYDEKRDFDLEKKFSELTKDLEKINFETISNHALLQLIALVLKGDCKRQAILNLDKNAFIETWPEAVRSVEKAAAHFHNVMRIPVSQLLPYMPLIVPFAYFFYKNDTKPDPGQKAELDNFFWRCSLAERYASSLESKLVQDTNRIDSILRHESPDYDWSIDVSPEFLIENGRFSLGSSFIKAILCVMTYQRPLSFNDNGIVNMSNNWLQRADSKNYHHFFPRAFLRKKGVSEDQANNIVNITIVDDYLNKREIGSKAPSRYMQKFQETNPDIAETMKTHLIGDLREFGILDDDYATFIRKRAKIISDKIKEKIIFKSRDAFGQKKNMSDTEE